MNPIHLTYPNTEHVSVDRFVARQLSKRNDLPSTTVIVYHKPSETQRVDVLPLADLDETRTLLRNEKVTLCTLKDLRYLV